MTGEEIYSNQFSNLPSSGFWLTTVWAVAWGKNDGDNTNANIVAKEKEHGNILLLVAMITAGG